MSKFIDLSKINRAIVDDDDYEWLSQWRWYIHSGGYAVRNEKYDTGMRSILMHRFIMDAPADMQVDHRNGNKLDNRRENLRLCTRTENQRNRRTSVGVSPYKGVSWHNQVNKWRATISVDKRQIFLGFFIDEIEAARSYDAAAIRYFGDFARLNFPD